MNLCDIVTDHIMSTIQPTNLPRLTTFDLGGHLQARRVWRDYFPAVDAVVFLVDSTDRARFRESKVLEEDKSKRSNCRFILIYPDCVHQYELANLLSDEQLCNCPVLVLGTKIDLAGAAGAGELEQQLGLIGLTNTAAQQPGRPLGLFMCSVPRKEGYGEAFRWVAQFLN